MVLLNEGLNKLATEVGNVVTYGQWGTGTADPLITNTGLGSALPDSLNAVGSAVSGRSCQFTHTTLTTESNGNTMTEYELRFTNGDSLNRILVAGIPKTSTYQVQSITSVTFTRG
jgi:hypothetical protein